MVKHPKTGNGSADFDCTRKPTSPPQKLPQPVGFRLDGIRLHAFRRDGVCPWDVPARFVGGHPDVAVIGACFGGGQQDQSRLQACGEVRLPNQFATDPASLISFVDRQIRQVGAINEIGQCPRNTDQAPVITGGDDHRSVFKHRLNQIWSIDRASLGQSRAMQNINELGGRQLRFDRVLETHNRARLLLFFYHHQSVVMADRLLRGSVY